MTIYKKSTVRLPCRSGTQTLRQVHFALIDLDLHTSFVPGEAETIFDRDRKVGGLACWHESLFYAKRMATNADC